MTEKHDTTAPVAADDVHHAGVKKTEDGAGPRDSMDEEALKVHQEQGDYSGARGKTDPKEIALVKKLDRRILPTLCVMYFLNYVRLNHILQICPPKLTGVVVGPNCHRLGASERS